MANADIFKTGQQKEEGQGGNKHPARDDDHGMVINKGQLKGNEGTCPEKHGKQQAENRKYVRVPFCHCNLIFFLKMINDGKKRTRINLLNLLRSRFEAFFQSTQERCATYTVCRGSQQYISK